MEKEMKRLIEFHQSQVKRFTDIDEVQKAFHKGAVMAFSESSLLFRQTIKSAGLTPCTNYGEDISPDCPGRIY